MINYQIQLQTNQNTYQIILSFIPTKSNHVLKLPTWLPGSYMIREFSKNITELSAVQHKSMHGNSKVVDHSHSLDNNLEEGDTQEGGRLEVEEVSCFQINKNTWHLQNVSIGQEVLIRYSVYAYDFGIRTAYLDHLRGFFNNSSLCLYIEGYEDLPHKIVIGNLPNGWDIATSLENLGNNAHLAKNYMELIDAPFELGVLKSIEFMVGPTKHYLILSGTILENIDYACLIEDLQKICAYQIKMFGDVAPFLEYRFLIHLGGEIYTGLEHARSAALLVPYDSLPITNSTEVSKYHDSKEYIKFLGLVSHEYFHSWNVKRIKPKLFSPYDLENENYTHLLWWFEGVTSYYDDLVLYRAGVISQKKYLQLILDNINNVYKYAGVNKQSLANSSLTTWIKYYRSDENTPNAVVNYYVKGAVLAMCLDLYLRNNTKTNLDHIIWSLYKKWQNDGQGIDEDELYNLISEYAGTAVGKWLKPYVYSCDMLPFIQLLKNFGVNLIAKQEAAFAANGVVTDMEEDNKEKTSLLAREMKTEKQELFTSIAISNKKCKIKSTNNITDIGCKLLKVDIGYKILNIYENSMAAKSNLAPNDVIIAINSNKLTNWDRQISLYMNLATISLTIFRRDILLTIEVNLEQFSCVNIYDLYIEDTTKLSFWL